MSRTKTKAALRRAHTPVLKNFSAGLIVMAELAPKSLTMAQCAFFLAAGLADRAGKEATFTELQEALGPVVNRSLHSTYQVFFAAGRAQQGSRAQGLGWLVREPDPNDLRRKYLKLTPLGQSILDEVAEALTYEE